jgi:hypothetical protein
MKSKATANAILAKKAIREISDDFRQETVIWDGDEAILETDVSTVGSRALVLDEPLFDEDEPQSVEPFDLTENRNEPRHEDTVADFLAKLPSIRQLPIALPLKASFDLLQQWECTVLDIRPDEFIAIARDRTDPKRPDEEIIFNHEDVNDYDLTLLKPGAVFYWNIGYRISDWGQKTKGSELRFRRLPAWSKREIDAVKVRATELASLFSDEDDV